MAMPLRFPDFYPRPPRGGRRENDSGPWAQTQISIHALREEGDNGKVGATTISSLFLSTPSARRATRRCSGKSVLSRDFYPRPPRGGRRRHFRRVIVGADISIHALREEGDQRVRHVTQTTKISIHALREEGDGSTTSTSGAFTIFLSTPSARRATRSGTAA